MNPSMLGLVIIIATLFIYAVCLLLKNRKLTPLFSVKPKMVWLRLLLAKSIEEGAPIHLDVVSTKESLSPSAGVLAAFATEKQIAHRMAAADESLIVTSCNGLSHGVNAEAVQAGFASAEMENQFEPSQTLFAGFSPLTHQATMLTMISQPIPLHFNIGSSGEEIALQDLMFNGNEALCVAGDNLGAQAVGMATADHVILGEECFELSPLFEEKKVDVGLWVMDILRYGFLAALGAGLLIALLGRG